MAKPQPVAHQENNAAGYEHELAEYLQERIKPGLNSGAIPLLARSIAKEIAHRERPDDDAKASGDEDERPEAESDEDPKAEADEDGGDDDPTAEADEEDGGDDDPKAEADEDDGDDDPKAEADEDDGDDDDPKAEADEDDDDDDDEPEPEGEAEDEMTDFEADMHDLQAELGEDWILRFSVQGDSAWLTAEKDDGSQRVEAPTAAVLTEAVQLLNDSGGRSD
jgi:hypothetical protein